MARIGIGFDAHKFAEGRDLILGGVKIDFDKGLLGHSDADVLIHAVCDAILGALALGDIGRHFPPSDPQYKDIRSTVLLEKTVEMARVKSYRVNNIDSVIIAEEPKLSNYIDKMRDVICNAAGVEKESVSVKATTTEGMGFTGRKEGIAAQAVASLVELK